MGAVVIKQKRPYAVLDIECYINFFSIGIKNVDNLKSVVFEKSPWSEIDFEALKSILGKYTIVTFNGNRYDMLVQKGCIAGLDNAKLKAMSNEIIEENAKSWDIERKYNLPQCNFIDHVDLVEVSPGIASLKTYGGRLHSKRMQDLPISPDEAITQEQRLVLNNYLVNDLDTTIDLFKKLEPQIELRRAMSIEYGIDLRSKSDAQIAEAVIKKQIETLKGERVFRPEFAKTFKFNYKAPSYIKFKEPQLVEALKVFENNAFSLSEKGEVAEPEEVGKLKIKLGRSVYTLGIGGIHSCEKKVHYLAGNGKMIIDRDVTSFYPNIILNQKLAPTHLGQDFLTVYRGIVERRIKAKREGNKVVDAALKVTINGSFGKFGSKWSTLFSPNLLIQTTVTGQLSLLMLIEALEHNGLSVVSANTDGIVIFCDKSDYAKVNRIVAEWEVATGFGTEETQYSALYSRDINNYIAIKTNGEVKTKGAYVPANLSKTPTAQVCANAVIDYLQLGIPIEDSVKACKDVRNFVSVRNVTGGAVKGDLYLGRAVRWYYAIGETGTINYKKNGNKVPKTDGAKPLMELPDSLPKDLDLQWYINSAKEMLKDFSVEYS